MMLWRERHAHSRDHTQPGERRSPDRCALRPLRSSRAACLLWSCLPALDRWWELSPGNFSQGHQMDRNCNRTCLSTPPAVPQSLSQEWRVRPAGSAARPARELTYRRNLSGLGQALYHRALIVHLHIGTQRDLCGPADEVSMNPFTLAVNLFRGGPQRTQYRCVHRQSHFSLAREDIFCASLVQGKAFTHIGRAREDPDSRVQLSCQADHLSTGL